MATQSRKRADVTVDFSGVEGGGRDLPNGTYTLEIVNVEEKESSEGNPYLAWKWKVANGTYKGTAVWDNTSLQPKALWRLKNLLDCLGVDTTQGKTGINFGELKGMVCAVKIENETYQGKQKPRIADFLREVVSNDAPSAPSLRKGTKVNFQSEGDDYTGEILSISGKTAIVKVEDEEWEIPLNELTEDVPY